LPKLYKLPCSCGLFIPVETNQAGLSLNCSCGQQLQVPSFSGILKLEHIPEQGVRKNEKVRQSKPVVSRSIHAKQVVMVIGAVATVVTILLFIFGAFIYPKWTTSYYIPDWFSRYPQLHDACVTQWQYRHGDKIIGRDTLPLSQRDMNLLVIPSPYGLLVWSEDAISKTSFFDFQPIVYIEMHDNFKGGPELSFNFYEKYDKLVFVYWAKFVVFGVLAIVSLIVLIVGIFLPKQVEEIGERGGESWE